MIPLWSSYPEYPGSYFYTCPERWVQTSQLVYYEVCCSSWFCRKYLLYFDFVDFSFENNHVFHYILFHYSGKLKWDRKFKPVNSAYYHKLPWTDLMKVYHDLMSFNAFSVIVFDYLCGSIFYNFKQSLKKSYVKKPRIYYQIHCNSLVT